MERSSADESPPKHPKTDADRGSIGIFTPPDDAAAKVGDGESADESPPKHPKTDADRGSIGIFTPPDDAAAKVGDGESAHGVADIPAPMPADIPAPMPAEILSRIHEMLMALLPKK